MSAYFHLLRARVRADARYRLSFWLRLFSAGVLVTGDYVVIWALLRRVGTIGGWDRGEITFLFGMSTVPFRIADAFVGGPVERCADLIRAGEFDRYLLRPIRPLVMLAGDAFAARRVAQLVAVVPFGVFGISMAHIRLDASHVAILVLMVVNAVLIDVSIFVTLSCFAFWSPGANEVANAFTYGGQAIAENPIHIMEGWLRAFTLTVVPVAFTVYVPSFLVLHAPNPLGVRPWMSWASFAVGPLLTLLAAAMWRGALRRYRSTGS